MKLKMDDKPVMIKDNFLKPNEDGNTNSMFTVTEDRFSVTKDG